MKKFTHLFGIVLIMFLLPKNLEAQKELNYVNPAWNIFALGSSIGEANFLCEDFNGDGTEELIFSGGGYYQAYLTVFEYEHNTYHPTWTSRYFSDEKVNVLLTIDSDEDGVYEIYVLFSNGDVEVYDGVSMEVIATYATNAEDAFDAKIADINNDGNLEYVVVSDAYGNQYLKIYDISNFSLIYETADKGGFQVEIGDVDGDTEFELILSDGHILDGSSLNVEWQYVNGFGRLIELGDTNGDNIPEIIGSTGYGSIVAFDGSLHTPLWQLDIDYYGIDDLLVTDVDGDGNDEMIIGVDDWSTAIVCYDAQTQSKLWENNDENSGISSIGVGDPDNDGIKEFFWGSGVGSTTPDYLHIAGFDYYQTEWRSLALDGHFLVSKGDINANDSLEILIGSSSSDNGYEDGVILTYKGLTKEQTHYLEMDNWYDLNCMKTGNINESDQSEIVVGIGGNLVVYDGLTYQQLWSSDEIGTIKDIEIADIDNDNDIEIITGDYDGFITIFNGKTFEQEWKSINTGQSVGGLEIENCDDDEALEIIFYNQNGIIQIYDGVTHYLEWQSASVFDVTALAVKDYNQDGIMDIIAGNNAGDLTFIKCDDFTTAETFSAFNEKIYSLEVDNLDSTTSMELFVGASSLKIFSTPDFELLWESDYLGANVGEYDNIILTDSDNDQYMEVLFGTSWGAYMYEATSRYLDITPPIVVSEVPPSNMQKIGTNSNINVLLSELMDEETITMSTIDVEGQDGTTISTSVVYDSSTNVITVSPTDLLPVEQIIAVTLSGIISDTTGNGLDGNRNGISEGSPEDDYVWTFTTGEGPDLVGPVFSTIEADSEEKWAGISIKIDGLLTDYSDYASSPIKYAEYFIDNIGNDGEGIKMNPVDGLYDELEEEINVIIPTTGWSTGVHTLYFHGQDFIGNWGEHAVISIYILDEASGSWTMYGNNPQHTGYNHFDTLILPLSLEWTKILGAQNMSPACLVNDKVVVSTDGFNTEKGLYVLDAETGEIDWFENMIEMAYVNPPSFAYGLIYMQVCNGSSDSYVRAYDITTGNLAWESPYGTQWSQHFAPTIAKERVFVNGGTYGGAYAFDAMHGYEYWFHSLPQYDDWTPAYHNDTIYTFTSIYNEYGYLAALDAHSGMLLWDKEDILFDWYGYSMGTVPVLDTTNRVIIVTSHNYQHAIDMDSHETIWYKSGAFKTPAVYNGTVYSANGNKLEAFNVLTGEKQWSFEASGSLLSQPAISGNHVYISTETKVHAIDLTSHIETWSYDAGGFLSLGLGRLFVSDLETGVLYAFKELLIATEEMEANADNVQLYQNYPNPGTKSERTTISYYIPKKSMVHLALYNLHGEEVGLLEEGIQTAGKHHVTTQLQRLPAGFYFYKLSVNGVSFGTKKLILVD